MYSFQYSKYLFALAAIPILVALYFYIIHWKKKTMVKIGDKNLIQQLIQNYSSRRFKLKFVLVTVAFAICVFALANLRSPKGSEKINRKGTDIMIALDVSKSMLATDITPTRLDRAKQLLNKLIDKLGDNRIGLVIFAGRAYLQMPLTDDAGSAKMFVNTITTDAVPTQGTVIAEALKMCATAFNDKEKKYKSVILISDGEDHDEDANKVAQRMAEQGIIINTIGIGSPEGSTIFDPSINEVKKDNNGNTVVTKLNELELKNLAKTGHGLYQLYSNTNEVVAKLNTQFNSMDQKVFAKNTSINYKSLFQFFLITALILLIVEIVISEKKKANGDRNKTIRYARQHSTFKSLLIILLTFTPFLLSAQNEKSLIKRGNDAYVDNKFDIAIKNYQSAASRNPSNSTVQYNLGNALYRNKKNQDAVQVYDRAIQRTSDPLNKAKAYYNKGVVLQNDNKIEECIEAYKNALKLSPDDDDARQNLQKALQQQKQQQQKKQQDKANKKNKDEKEDNNKQQQKPKDEDKKENDKPEPDPSKMSKQDAEEKLKALSQQEKNLQDKLRKVSAEPGGRPAKDW